MTAAVTTTNADVPASENNKIDQSEVGWMFVGEYYTFLNKDPNKLHCFYTKKSTLIHGTEGEPETAYYGQQEIHKKILELGFDDCKIHVSNVDSQASADGGIIIQVLGEMSNKSGPSQKFAQTFFLAVQPNGFYVRNDIFRYLKEEMDSDYTGSERDESAETNELHTQQQETAVEVQDEPNTSFVPEEQSLIYTTEQLASEDYIDPSTLATDAHTVPADVPTLDPSPSAIDSETAQSIVSDEDVTSGQEVSHVNGHQDLVTLEPVERLEESNDTTEDQHSKISDQQTVQPSGPQSWANLAATNSQKWGNQASELKGQVAPVITPSPRAPQQQQRPTEQKMPREKFEEPFSIFVRGINSRITSDMLQKAFSKFGTVTNADLVINKQCAFVHFTTAEACTNAIQARNILVGTDTVVAEERRKSAPRGSGNDRGRGNYTGERRNTRDFAQQQQSPRDSPAVGQERGQTNQNRRGRGGERKNSGRVGSDKTTINK